MNKKIVALVTSAALLAFPAVMLAGLASPVVPGTIGGTPWTVLIKIFDFIWPLFIGAAIIMFIVAGFIFLTAQGNPGKVEQARNAVIWGVVGIVIGILAFSFPLIIQTALGL